MMETISGPYTLKQIFQDHWESFKEKHKDDLREAIVEEVEKVQHCRDFFCLGHHEYQCPKGCSCKRIVPHSCKSRFCSSCGKIATDNWMNKAPGDFLDVPYHHIVFTIPAELRNIFAWDRAALGVLFTAAKDTVLVWCRDKGGYIPGVVTVLHTFGSDLKLNPHIHMLITEGGLSPDRTRWVHNEYIPWSMLKSRWKTLVIKGLRPRLKEIIQQGLGGSEYQQLEDSQSFLCLLGRSASEDVVRQLG